LSAEVTEAQPAAAAVVEVLETDEAKGLLDLGREAGSLTQDEIALALDELDLDEAHAAQLWDYLVMAANSLVNQPAGPQGRPDLGLRPAEVRNGRSILVYAPRGPSAPRRSSCPGTSGPTSPRCAIRRTSSS